MNQSQILSTESVQNRRKNRWHHSPLHSVDGRGLAQFEQGLLAI